MKFTDAFAAQAYLDEIPMPCTIAVYEASGSLRYRAPTASAEHARSVIEQALEFGVHGDLFVTINEKSSIPPVGGGG